MSRDRYRSAIFNAQVYANTGAGTYEKAVDMAVHDMLAAGLNCVVYSNGARHTLRDYASMAIRTANKRAYLMGAGEQRNRWGIHTVVVNNRRGGCRECAQYIGRVFIDDVYSGGTKADGDYPLLSDPIKNRLFHPNCKDSTSTYYEGITTLKPVTEEELREMDRREALEQRQNYYDNQAKRNRRIADHSLDPDNRRKYAARAKTNEEKAEKYREKLGESIAKSEESGIIELPETLPLEDIQIFRTLSARAQNYDIMDLSSGDMFRLAEGTKIQNVQVFAGKGTRVVFRNAQKYAEKYGGIASDWQHVKGFADLNTKDGIQRAEIHWVQCQGIGKKEFFVKRWLE